MGGFFRSKKFRIILCIIALLIGMMLYAVTQDGYTLPTTGFLDPESDPFGIQQHFHQCAGHAGRIHQIQSVPD